MPSESARFDALLAKLAPSLRLKKLEDELNGVDGKPGLAHQFVDAVTDARVQEDLAARKQAAFKAMKSEDYPVVVYEQARLDAAQATYSAISRLLIADTLGAEIERVTAAIEAVSEKAV